MRSLSQHLTENKSSKEKEFDKLSKLFAKLEKKQDALTKEVSKDPNVESQRELDSIADELESISAKLAELSAEIENS